MIHVSEQPKPIDFDDSDMRRKGREYLNRVRDMDKIDFSGANYWTLAAKTLNDAYRGICAYTCFYIPGGGEIDHFLPKGRKEYRELAYEWSNFRLALGKVNQFKGNSIEVLDPFLIESGWFILDFPSCLVKPGDELTHTTRTRIERTIEVLKLNKHDRFVQDRCWIMQQFAEGHITLAHMKANYPFLAAEIHRQGIETKANEVFKKRSW